MDRGDPSAIAQNRLFEPLVSRKVANREVRTEEGRAFKKCLVDIFSEGVRRRVGLILILFGLRSLCVNT